MTDGQPEDATHGQPEDATHGQPEDATHGQLGALVDAAADGIECDGLQVARTDTGGDANAGGTGGSDAATYTFETPAAHHTDLDEDSLRAVAAEYPQYVSNWFYWTRVERPDAETAFLRWLEDADDLGVPERYERLADGTTASWGQLHVDVTLGEAGHRRYDVRNEADSDTAFSSLDIHGDPLDARALVTYDDDGRYRPLKTAPTLPTGWAFVDLDGRELARTVEEIYPATVANWHLEREGELDVSHWRETMARQTGIYGVVETWDRGEGHEHVNWVAEACCADSQCLKRREWEYDDETDLDVDGGDGAFPCREPCSLVVSAARQWTKLEGEDSKTYEFELTPSEKEQLEAIVDAVADGTTEEIREADVYEGANRYRARFLRAKRFDDDGNLCGVPTDDEE